MTFQDLLLHVDLSDASALRTDAAIALAAGHEAHLTALCLLAQPYLPTVASVSVPAETLGSQLRAAEDEAAELLARVRARAEAAGVRIELRREAAPIAQLPQVLATHARYADLAIVGQPNPEIDGLDDALLAETSFLDTGRPALVVPYVGARTMPPERAMVCWSGTRESVRAVHDALPLLRQARRVVVLVVDAARLASQLGPDPGADLAAHLARHGIAAEARAVESAGLRVGDVILAEAAAEGTDLLVMGAFGHSRLRELIIGGVTRQLLKEMTVPVLFSH